MCPVQRCKFFSGYVIINTIQLFEFKQLFESDIVFTGCFIRELIDGHIDASRPGHYNIFPRGIQGGID